MTFAQILRKAFKEAGYNNKMVSVTKYGGVMNDAASVRIRSADVDFDVISAIVRKFREVKYHPCGDPYLSGNRFAIFHTFEPKDNE